MSKAVSDNLRALLALRGITEEELAFQMGVSRRSVVKWVRQGSVPLARIERMGELFGVQPEEVVSASSGLAAQLSDRLAEAGGDKARAGLPARARVGWLSR